MLDKVQIGLKRANKLSSFKNEFVGTLSSEVTCQKCGFVSKTNEEFMTLSLVRNYSLIASLIDLGNTKIQ